MSEESTDSRRRPMPACGRVSFKRPRFPLLDIWPHYGQIFEKNTQRMVLGPFEAGYPKVKSPKMGLPITPLQFLKRPTLFSRCLSPLGTNCMETGLENINTLKLLGLVTPVLLLQKQSFGKRCSKWHTFRRKSGKWGFQLFGFRKSKVVPPEANTTCSPSKF